MSWTLTTSLARLRADLNAAFPKRDHESDGTIGDAAHQAETSGHNPDDTAGSKSEYTDADAKPEVRAFDADNDLRDPRGTDFQQVIDRILATPADRDRLAYVIHRRKIWRKKNGWRQETYTGSSPHTEHAHFSGDPVHDENAAPWLSVLAFQEEDNVAAGPTIGDWRVLALLDNSPTTKGPDEKHANGLAAKLEEILAAAKAQSAAVDTAAVAALVVEQLGPLLPTLAEIEAIVDTKVKAALNATRLAV